MSCEKEEHMRSENTRLPRRSTPAWPCLLVGGALVLLSACGSGSPSSTGSDSTPTPVPGYMQVLLITNTSNGSFGFTPAKLMIRVGTTVI
jgi:hypothetical protein